MGIVEESGRISLPVTPEISSRQFTIRFGGVIGMLLLAHFYVVRDVIDTRETESSAFAGLAWVLVILIIDVLTGVVLYLFLRHMRIVFSAEGIHRHSEKSEPIILWSEVREVVHIGGVGYSVRGSSSKITVMPDFYKDAQSVRRILLENLRENVRLPRYLVETVNGENA